MATRKTVTEPVVAPKLLLSPQKIEHAITCLDERISELNSFDLSGVSEGNPPALNALSVAIQDTLTRCFGENTAAYARFEPASKLSWFRMVISAGYRTSPREFQENIRGKITRSIALLEEAKRVLREDLADAAHEIGHTETVLAVDPQERSRRVFVVHGHDGEAREVVARFLKAMDFDPVILHEQPNQGGTVIEKFEVNSDVGFAVVLLTPDDVGRSVKENELRPRARQNVLLELGYFIGRLGRKNVCALKRGDVELPSDYVGVLWEKMDDGGGWKLALARELKAAGLGVDLNKAFLL